MTPRERVLFAYLRQRAGADPAYVRKFNQLGLKLYIDMDGVLTDFTNQYKEYTGKAHTEGNTGMDWDTIDSVEFWESMKWMSDGQLLWERLAPLNPIILSSPSREESSKIGKTLWVQKHLGDRVQLILDRNKYQYASPISILIDDMPKNIDPWKEAGGLGLLHKDAEDSSKRLMDYMASCPVAALSLDI